MKIVISFRTPEHANADFQVAYRSWSYEYYHRDWSQTNILELYTTDEWCLHKTGGKKLPKLENIKTAGILRVGWGKSAWSQYEAYAQTPGGFLHLEMRENSLINDWHQPADFVMRAEKKLVAETTGIPQAIIDAPGWRPLLRDGRGKLTMKLSEENASVWLREAARITNEVLAGADNLAELVGMNCDERGHTKGDLRDVVWESTPLNRFLQAYGLAERLKF